MPEFKHKLFTLCLLGLFFSLGGCIGGNQGDPGGEVAVEHQDSRGQGEGAGPKIFISGESNEGGLEAGFREETGEGPDRAERVGGPEGEARVAEETPVYEIHDFGIKMEVAPIKHPFEVKYGELANLQMTRDNLQRQNLIYAGTERGQEISEELRIVDDQIATLRQEIRDLEDSIHLSQIRSWIEFLEKKLVNLEGNLNLLRGQNRAEVHHDDETGGTGSNEATLGDISTTERKINDTKGEIVRFQQIWNRRATLEDINTRISQLTSELEALRNSENSYRRSKFNMVERGASESEIERTQARIEEVLDKIDVISREISTLERLRREKT